MELVLRVIGLLRARTCWGYLLLLQKASKEFIGSNLVGMGVIPFEFTNGDTRKSLGLTGSETVSIGELEGDIKPQSLVPCTITFPNGDVKEITLKSRIDTAVEIEYLEHGGVLHYVLRNLAKAS